VTIERWFESRTEPLVHPDAAAFFEAVLGLYRAIDPGCPPAPAFAWDRTYELPPCGSGGSTRLVHGGVTWELAYTDEMVGPGEAVHQWRYDARAVFPAGKLAIGWMSGDAWDARRCIDAAIADPSVLHALIAAWDAPQPPRRRVGLGDGHAIVDGDRLARLYLGGEALIVGGTAPLGPEVAMPTPGIEVAAAEWAGTVLTAFAWSARYAVPGGDVVQLGPGARADAFVGPGDHDGYVVIDGSAADRWWALVIRGERTETLRIREERGRFEVGFLGGRAVGIALSGGYEVRHAVTAIVGRSVW
jgi:hypothetical protein